MAEITYPLNDVMYDASDAELYNSTRNSGVYASSSFNYSVTGASNIMTVGKGLAWIKNAEFSGKVYANTADVSLEFDLADSSLNRYDVMVIRFDSAQNKTYLTVKKGTVGSTPSIPAPSRTATLYELYICAVYRPAGSVVITSNNITDLRLDPTYCGIMGDAITEIDTSGINNQVTELIEDLKKAIQDIEVGSGVMLTSVYDIDQTGTVDVAKRLISQTTQDMSIYVSKTGNDETGDGSEGLPFFSIDKAISIIPKQINHSVTVTIESGAYDFSTIKGFYGLGTLRIQASDYYNQPQLSFVEGETNDTIADIDVTVELWSLVFTAEYTKFSSIRSRIDLTYITTKPLNIYNCSDVLLTGGTIDGRDYDGSAAVFQNSNVRLSSEIYRYGTRYHIAASLGSKVSLNTSSAKSWDISSSAGALVIHADGAMIGPLSSGEFEIYNNSSGTQGTIAGAFSLYDEITIYYRHDPGTETSTTIRNPVGKKVALAVNHYYDVQIYTTTAYYTITSSSISKPDFFYGQGIFRNGQNAAVTWTNGIWITRITGYKTS